ncbi:hypothetical protein K388_05606 [Streptomyces sp. KhCrAH-43]|uniref:hypothetical protein n=1 Tax=unclassified Streptomyces TaxID=2593676 RepID=UPI00039A14D8|nr:MULTISPECIES: hypothetical protein [unclassified Streptomyces]MYX67339.1 hypothetical protein [Streptomyces sp. SID8373]RAJ53819.1 hypothetical protein K388_05606 [Streptomyces sp. KhCrAH-43]
MSIPWGDIATFSTAGLSAVAAAGAWFAAHRANRTADTVARIEEQRWHAELTPQFSFELMETGNGQALLDVHLEGPDFLGHLDSISIAVGNDDRGHPVLNAGVDVTQEEVDAFVWGPYRFSPHADGADEHGRSPEPFDLAVGTGTRRAMQRTRPGHWMEGKTPGTWQGEYVGKPIRLKLTCRRGDEEWVITRHLENPLYEADA